MNESALQLLKQAQNNPLWSVESSKYLELS